MYVCAGNVDKRQRAFTLLELCLVIAVLSVMIGGIMSAYTQSIQMANQESLKKKMNTIYEALTNYSRRYGKLPCPGDLTLGVSATHFGDAGTTAGNCMTSTVQANYSDSYSAEGSVPVRDLGLSEDYSFDPWGGHIVYVVTKAATEASSFSTYSLSSTTIGAITIWDENNNNRTTSAMVALISMGPNGHGAWQSSGVRKNSRSWNANENQNCHCDDTLVVSSYDSIFVQQIQTTNTVDQRNSFDDIVLYYMRAQFAKPADLSYETR